MGIGSSHDQIENVHRFGGLSQQQVDGLKSDFEKYIQDSKGFLDKFKFQEYLNLKQTESSIINTLYEYFDLDKSKQIDYYKFLCGICQLRQLPLPNKAELLFHIFNYDQGENSKIITKEEFNKFLIVIRQISKKFDKNFAKNSNQLDDESQIEELVEKYFKAYDVNKDESFSLQEFQQIFYNDKQANRILHILGLYTNEDHEYQQSNCDPDDDDLLQELNLHKKVTDEDTQRIKEGIEHNVKTEDEMFGVEQGNQGDQFMAVKPWEGAVRASVPSNYKPKKEDADAPNTSLSLEYVYGYRCHDARNNLRYGPNNEIVYHTAGVGINLNAADNTQKFFVEHTDDILCLDVWQNFAITGQIGHKPLLCVWDFTTQEAIVTLKGVLEKGINNVCFSSDGTKFAASGLDDDHCIVIYDLQKLRDERMDPTKAKNNASLIASGKGSKANILDLKFSVDNNQLIAACNKEMYFYNIDASKKILQAKKGLFGGNPPLPVMCVGFVGNQIVSGMSSGDLYTWSGNSCVKKIKAHEGSVNAIFQNQGRTKLYTGGNDGLVKIWSQTLAQETIIDVAKVVPSINPKVRSICLNKSGKLLVGTRGSEIIEFNENFQQGKILMKGHFDDELWGLAVHKNNKEFFTVGEDKLLACWDIKDRKQKNKTMVKFAAKAIDVSSDGKHLAVGCKNGIIQLFDPSTLKATAEAKEQKEISIVKFSPKNHILCIGIAPPVSKIFIYNVENFKWIGELKSISRIIHIDFAVENNILQYNNSSYEIIYYNTETKKQLTSGASQNKDEKWNSWTCIIGWPVQGIWPPCSDGSDVNSVDRSKRGDVLATADDFGKVKLFKYPCPVKNAQFKKYSGHSSHVTNVRFTAGDTHLISTGGEEKSIFQWKYDDGVPDEEDVQYDEDYELELGQNANQEEQEGGESKQQNIRLDDQEVDEFGIQDNLQGDEVGAVKPFLGNIFPPSNFKKAQHKSTLPAGTLSIHYVHGYRCFDDCRNTAKYIYNGNIVFVGAATGVIMNSKTPTQTFFNQHIEDIVSMAVHPSKKIVATGQMAAKGKAKTIDLFVWNVDTKEAYCNLNSFHLREVCLLSFSPDGTKLLSVGKDDDNSLAIHDWQSKNMLANGKTDKAFCLATAWNDNNNFVTCGIKHIKFWTLNGRNLEAKRGTIGQQTFEPQLCACFIKQSCITGTAKGNITQWKGSSAIQTIQAHKGNVSCVFATQNELYTGGQDGQIKIWNMSSGSLPKSPTSVFLDISKISKFNPEIRSMDFSETSQNFLVGTRGSEIYEFIQKNPQNYQLKLQGHFLGEVWGCAASPNNHNFASCGGDKTLRIWDAQTHKMIDYYQFENDVRAVDWSSDGEFLIVADMKGKVHLLQVNNGKLTFVQEFQSMFVHNPKKAGDPWIEDIKISPNNTLCVLGAHQGNFNLEVLKISKSSVGKGNLLQAALTGATAHLDWSEDSNVVVINSWAYELMFMDVNPKGGKRLAASSQKDTEFATWTCSLGWPVQGIFPGVDYSDINTVCRSHSRKYMVTGDDFSQVNLLNYPCPEPKGKFKSYKGHSSHVTKVKFSYDDNFVFSTGGNDKCVIVWETSFGNKDNLQNVSLIQSVAPQKKQVQKQQQRKQQQQDDNGEIEEEEGINEDINYTDQSTVETEIIDDDCIQQKRIKPKVQNEGLEIKQLKGENAIFEQDDTNQGDEFMAVKPWLGAIKEPTNYKKLNNQAKPPDATIKLNYVFGYRAKDCRNNVYYLKNGNFVYNAAGLGIVMDQNTEDQKFFDQHSDDITAIAVHPDGVQVATGELGKKPIIFVWSSDTMEVIHKLEGALFKGIACLAFSPSGNSLVGSAIDDDHNMAGWNVSGKVAKLLFKQKGGKEIIRDMDFKDDTHFVTCGVKHYYFWTIAQSIAKGQKGSGIMPTIMTCAQYNGNDIVVATASGELQIWTDTAYKKSIPISKPAGNAVAKKLEDDEEGEQAQGGAQKQASANLSLDALEITDKYIFVGGRDMKIYILNKQYQIVNEVYLQKVLGDASICPRLRSVKFNSNDPTILLIGTYGSEIFEIKASSAVFDQRTTWTMHKKRMSGHYTPNQQWTNELWGLAPFPKTKYLYATCSDDGTLRVWDNQLRKQVKCIQTNLNPDGKTVTKLSEKTGDLVDSVKGRCLNIDQEENWIVIGCKDGTVKIFDNNSENLTQLQAWKCAKEWISDLTFSPNNQLLAIGSHDNAIYIYKVPSDSKGKFTLKCRLNKHSSYITHLDWSEDSAALHSTCGAYELLFWDAIQGKQMTNGATALRDENWATWTVTLGWPVQGIWPACADGTDINYVDKSKKQHKDGYHLVALGDDFGKVRILRYPSIQKNSNDISGKGHCSHVPCVKWSPDDEFLYSVGGEDQCVFQWVVEHK